MTGKINPTPKDYCRVNGAESREEKERKLDLIHRRIEATDVALRTLTIQAIPLRRSDVRDLTRKFEQSPALTSLSLIGDQIGPEGAFVLSIWLLKDRFLRHLNLQGNDIPAESADDIGSAILYHPSLTSLNLGHNCLSNQGASNLAEFIGHNSRVTSLSLASNQIKDLGAIPCMSLLQAPALTKLNLSGNSFTPTQLLESADHNTSLTQLDLRGSVCTKQDLHAIGQLLTGNTSLRTLGLTLGLSLTLHLPRMSAALAENSHLKYVDFECNGPSLDFLSTDEGHQLIEKGAGLLQRNRTLVGVGTLIDTPAGEKTLRRLMLRNFWTLQRICVHTLICLRGEGAI